MQDREFTANNLLECEEYDDKLYAHITNKYNEFELWFSSRKTKKYILTLILIHMLIAVLSVFIWVFVDMFLIKLETTLIAKSLFPILFLSYIMFFIRYLRLQRIQPMPKYLFTKYLIDYDSLLHNTCKNNYIDFIKLVDDSVEILKIREQVYIDQQYEHVRLDLIVNLLCYYLVLIDAIYYVMRYLSSIQIIFPHIPAP